MASIFWDSEGLKQVAQLVKHEAERSSQKVIAEKAGFSEQTISNLLLNLYNSNGNIVKPPKPETVLLLASWITNPSTGQPFDPEDFLAIARGIIRRSEENKVADTPGTYRADGHPYPAAQRELKRLMKEQNLTLAQAAESWQLTPERLEELLNGTDNRAIPSLFEIQKIVKVSYPDKLLNRISDLYLEPQKMNGSPAKAKRSANADSQ